MISSLPTTHQNFSIVKSPMIVRWRNMITLVIALALPPTVLAGPFTGINFFGDSLTDTGNIFTLTSAAIPDSNYFNGRFSNGPVYSERLAGYLGLPLTPSLLGGSNFAFGSANTDSPEFSVLNQVGGFIGGLGGGMADQDALYVLFAGSNNVQDAARFFGSSNQGFAEGLVQSAANDVLTMINQLSAVGADHFLVFNSPDLGQVPRFTELGIPGLTTFSTALTLTFNNQLQANLDTLLGIDLISFDTFSFLNQVSGDPGFFGLTNTTDRCYTGDDVTFTGGGTVCANPEQYLYFDGLHPTTGIHKLVAQRALVALNIPEPAPIFLVLIGLVSMGWMRFATYNPRIIS